MRKLLVNNFLVFLSLAGLLLTTACSSNAVHKRLHNADQIAKEAGFQKNKWAGGTYFELVGYDNYDSVISQKNQDEFSVPARTARIFIEGDGYSWITPTKISPNPTPRNPVGLDLAVNDCSEVVYYLGRPCQYQDLRFVGECTPEYWTSEIYSKTVVDSYHAALDKIKDTTTVRKFELVGYSGGATIAARLAHERDDVALLMTVAGNLDTEGFTNHHRLTPYNEHINPRVIAPFIEVPQIHFVGAEDNVIKPFMVKNFVKSLSDKTVYRYYVVKNVDHRGKWPKVWDQYKLCFGE